jgi:hypothetical protein
MQERPAPVPTTCPEVIYLNLHLSPHIIFFDLRNDHRPAHLRATCHATPTGSGAWRDRPDISTKQENRHSLNGSGSSTIAEHLRAPGLVERQVQTHVANLTAPKHKRVREDGLSGL